MRHLFGYLTRGLLSCLLIAPSLGAVGPVLPGQSLWCISKRIGSTVDVIESKVCALEPAVLDEISISQNVLCSKMDELSLFANLTRVMEEVSESDERLCSKLEVIDSKVDEISPPIIETQSISTAILCSKMEELSLFANLTRVMEEVSESDEMLCSKLEVVDSIMDVINEIVLELDTSISIHDEEICSKLEVIDSKVDEITFIAELQPALDDISEQSELLCSKLEIVQDNQTTINNNVTNVDSDLSIHDEAICSKLEVIESKIDELSLVADLQPVLDDISEQSELLCSKLEIVQDNQDTIITNVLDVDTDLSIHDEAICSKLEVIESKIDEISLVADLQPILDDVSQVSELLCSKLEIVQDNQMTINDNVLNIDSDISIHDVTICSKLEVIESKIDEITFVLDLQPVLDAISETEEVLCSKTEGIESDIDVVNTNVLDVDLDLSIHNELMCSKMEIIESKICYLLNDLQFGFGLDCG